MNGQNPIWLIERGAKEHYKVKDVHGQTGVGTRKITGKNQAGYCNFTFLWRLAVICQVD